MLSSILWQSSIPANRLDIDFWQQTGDAFLAICNALLPKNGPEVDFGRQTGNGFFRFNKPETLVFRPSAKLFLAQQD
jgi:hypothetical protein